MYLQAGVTGNCSDTLPQYYTSEFTLMAWRVKTLWCLSHTSDLPMSCHCQQVDKAKLGIRRNTHQQKQSVCISTAVTLRADCAAVGCSASTQVRNVIDGHTDGG